MRKALRYILYSTAAVLAVAVAVAWALLLAAQSEPEFYQRALKAQPTGQAEAGDSLERSLLDLHNSVHGGGSWEAVFTEDQINGWLAADLPDKFPRALPPGAEEPRVAIDSQMVHVACRFDNGKVRTVISFGLDVNLTTETNTLAVRVSKLRAGALPVPLKQFLDKISAHAQRANIPLQWSQIDGDPVALVTIPVQHEDYAHREVYLDVIELREGEVYLAGRTEATGSGTRHVALQPVALKLAVH